jgi:hypothetical protein
MQHGAFLCELRVPTTPRSSATAGQGGLISFCLRVVVASPVQGRVVGGNCRYRCEGKAARAEKGRAKATCQLQFGSHFSFSLQLTA